VSYTFTEVIMRVSPEAYAEIKQHFLRVGHDDVFHQHRDGETASMHGICIQADPSIKPVVLQAERPRLKPHDLVRLRRRP
jgi:hypothetical protein